MTVTVYKDIIQGSEEWLALRCGILTASEMKKIITPTLRFSQGDHMRSHMYEIAAQRVNKYVEPSYIGDDMLRGMEDEVYARDLYSKNYAQAEEVGFITNQFDHGFTLGCSPDGLVREDGIIEIKSRCQKYHFQTLVSQSVPEDFYIQIQSALLITQRKWCDFVSYCGGMPMVTIRVFPDKDTAQAILEAASIFEGKVSSLVSDFSAINEENNFRLIPTERRVQQEITL